MTEEHIMTTTNINEPLKTEISQIWDLHSNTYDRAGGMIQTAGERDAWLSFIAKELPGGKLNVLDVGCGTGEISLLLAGLGHTVTGIDLSEKMMDHARTKARQAGLSVIFKPGDAEHTGFEAGTFDVVICRFLLWTLPHPEQALQEWYRIMKECGKVLIIDGKWHDDTIQYKLVKKASHLSIRLIDGKNTEKKYSAELIESLRHLDGVPPVFARFYLAAPGFKNIKVTDLEGVRKIKLSSVPWRYRAGIGRKYYLIVGTK